VSNRWPPITVSVMDLLTALDDVVGTGEEPDGLCADRSEHRAHLHDSRTLGSFWCTAQRAAARVPAISTPVKLT
jgi:hypothetical protein